MASFTHFIGTTPEFEVSGDNIIVSHEGMDPLAIPMPVFRAAVYQAFALIKQVDEERRSKAGLHPLDPACVGCGRITRRSPRKH